MNRWLPTRSPCAAVGRCGARARDDPVHSTHRVRAGQRRHPGARRARVRPDLQGDPRHQLRAGRVPPGRRLRVLLGVRAAPPPGNARRGGRPARRHRARRRHRAAPAATAGRRGNHLGHPGDDWPVGGLEGVDPDLLWHHAAHDAQGLAARLGRDPRRGRTDRPPGGRRGGRGGAGRVQRVLPLVAPRRRDARGRRRPAGRTGPGDLGPPDLRARVGDGCRERGHRRSPRRRHRRGQPEPRRLRSDRVSRCDPRRSRLGARDDHRRHGHRPRQPVRGGRVAWRFAGGAVRRARRHSPRAALRLIRPAADREGVTVPSTATGLYHTSYESDLRLRHTRSEKARLVLCIAVVLALPFMLNNYWLGIVNAIGIAAIGAIGLNILVGFTGQISLGQGGFLAVGAFTSALLAGRAGLPIPLAIAGAVVVTATAGAVVGLPALRLKGLYLAIATLASQVIIITIVRRWTWLTGGEGYLEAPPLGVLGWQVQRTSFEDAE